MFHRLYQASGDERLAGAARAWLEPTLRLGPAADEPGILFGSGGIALALASLFGADASWDRAFALSC
jgi:hypothetical protein